VLQVIVLMRPFLRNTNLWHSINIAKSNNTLSWGRDLFDVARGWGDRDSLLFGGSWSVGSSKSCSSDCDVSRSVFGTMEERSVLKIELKQQLTRLMYSLLVLKPGPSFVPRAPEAQKFTTS